MKTNELIAAIKDTGREPVAYSGRGMYGAHCVAVYLDQYDAGGDLPQAGASWDSMGKGRVIYWKRNPAPEDLQ